MKTNFLLFLFSILSIPLFSQGGYNNMTNHQKGNYAIEPSFNMGKNNMGGQLMVGYYISDFFQVRLGATYRNFSYKVYKENILEGNIEAVYTFITPKYDTPFLHHFNIAGTFGIDYESVKVKSNHSLIDPYPQYLYLHIGPQLEFTASDRFGIVVHYKQYYAVNGKKETLGNWRYDYGIGIRYYFWGR